MAHVSGSSRYQATLFPEVLDDMVAADHPVRVIDAFVDSLDLAQLGFTRVETEDTGRPPYRPADLLKLYVYGYLNLIRSSRRLEREAGRNVEVLWLINRVCPSFKTIADFRKDHAKPIVAVCRALTAFCRGQELLGGELVAIDGTKVGAVASRKQVITPEKMAKQAAALDRKIVEHLAAMDSADEEEDGEPPQPIVDVAKALAELVQRRQKVQRHAERLADNDLKQLVLTEQDAKLMRTSNHGHQVAYNAQIAVDAEHSLIAAFELTNDGNDTQQLHPMAEMAKEALAVESLNVVADTGYSSGEQAELCAQSQITAIVPRKQTANTEGDQYFTRNRFSYDATNDTYQCPAGRTLRLEGVVAATGKRSYANVRACKICQRSSLQELCFEDTVHEGRPSQSNSNVPRRRCRGDAPTCHERPAMDERTAIGRRASIRDDQMDARLPSFPGSRSNQGKSRNGPQRALLQSETALEYPWRARTPGKASRPSLKPHDQTDRDAASTQEFSHSLSSVGGRIASPARNAGVSIPEIQALMAGECRIQNETGPQCHQNVIVVHPHPMIAMRRLAQMGAMPIDFARAPIIPRQRIAMVPAVMMHRHSHHPAAHRAVMIGIVMIPIVLVVGEGGRTCSQRGRKYPNNQLFHDCSAPSGASSSR